MTAEQSTSRAMESVINLRRNKGSNFRLLKGKRRRSAKRERIIGRRLGCFEAVSISTSE